MPNELSVVLREFSDPATLPGAVVCAVTIAVVAWLAGRFVRLAVHRSLDGHAPHADPTVVRFLGQLARLVIYIIALLSFVDEFPSCTKWVAYG